MDTKHTPLPWVIHERTGRFHLTSQDNAESKANAEFICRAVNNHYELLEACKAAVIYLKSTPNLDEPGQMLSMSIKSAIARAEGTQQ
jgi:hypothetical protein